MKPIFKLTNVSVNFGKHAIKHRSLKYSLSTFLDEKEKPRFNAPSDVNLSIHDGEQAGREIHSFYGQTCGDEKLFGLAASV